MPTALNIRQGQRHFLRLVDQYRLIAFLARRQYGKTTTFAKVALKKMMKNRDHTVIFGSAKLNLSREIVRKEAQILQAAIDEAIASARAGALQVADSGTNKVPDVLSADDFADLFEAQRLEFRFFHSNTSYSRTKVVALRDDTVGETGDLMCDEIGRVKSWREVWEAVEPIVASNPTFCLTLSTTVPPDDSHYSFEQLVPPVGTEFEPNPEGNLYESEMGIMVLRLDAEDAYADGIPIYDLKDGAALDPQTSRMRSHDKDAWDRNYGCKFIMGGTSACGLMQLQTAQERGIGQCLFMRIEEDSDMDIAIAFLDQHLGEGKVGLGFDVATTENKTSNPSAFAACEQIGVDKILRLVVAWKTTDPDLAEERIGRLIQAVNNRRAGGRAKRFCIDATNEKYFASRLQKKFRAEVPVELVVGSVGITKPGYEPMNMKQYTGSLFVGELEDNHLTLPPERYIREDFRLVKRSRGTFDCTADGEGRHGDTFDGGKLANYALTGNGAFEWETVQNSDPVRGSMKGCLL